MVYCGKPSASCAACRVKKTRCDKTQPACGKCQRSGQECPGYNNPQSLVFRDESSRVIDKLQSQNQRKRQQRNGNGVRTKMATTPGQKPMKTHTADSPEEDEVLSPSISSSFLCRESNEPEFGDDDQLQVLEPELGLDLDWDLDAELNAEQTDNFPITISPYSCSPSLPLSSLRSCFKDLGVNYFISHFVLAGSGPSPGFFAYVPSMLSSLDSRNVLILAVEAVGLACLANTTNHADMKSQARSVYANTLNILNQSIADPHESLKDSTILSVVLLGVFEAVTCSNKSSFDTWTKHIRGAAALVAHRGSAQFQTPLGLQIFHETMSHLLISCSRARRPISIQIRMLHAQASTFTNPSSPARIVVGALIESIELSHCVHADQIELYSKEALERYLVRAVGLDRELESHFAQIPLEWRYKTVEDPFANPEFVHEGKYHVYQDNCMPQVWNCMRACRILLNVVIANLLMRVPVTSWSSGAYAGLARDTAETLDRMRDAILCSVPQLMGSVGHHGNPNSSLTYSESPADHVNCTSGCYYLLWNLYLAGTLPDTSKETKAWITGRLKAIGNVMGIHNAQFLAELLESGEASTVEIDTDR